MRMNTYIMSVAQRHNYHPVSEAENVVRDFGNDVYVRVRYNLAPNRLTIVVSHKSKAVYTSTIASDSPDDMFISATTIGDMFSQTYALSERLSK